MWAGNVSFLSFNCDEKVDICQCTKNDTIQKASLAAIKHIAATQPMQTSKGGKGALLKFKMGVRMGEKEDLNDC